MISELVKGRCGLLVAGWEVLLFVFDYWAMREALTESGVLQGFHYFSSEEHEQHRDRDDTENGAGH